jgi:hypothetical protein
MTELCAILLKNNLRLLMKKGCAIPGRARREPGIQEIKDNGLAALLALGLKRGRIGGMVRDPMTTQITRILA